eukprot:6568367-Alexandrium_andersonii.AAC.1
MDTAGAEPRVSVSDRVRAIEAGGDSEPSDKAGHNHLAAGPQRPAPSLRRGTPHRGDLRPRDGHAR